MEINLDEDGKLNEYYNLNIKDKNFIGKTNIIFIYKNIKVPCSIQIDGNDLIIQINSNSKNGSK